MQNIQGLCCSLRDLRQVLKCLPDFCRFQEFHNIVYLRAAEYWKFFDACLCKTSLDTVEAILTAACQIGKSLLTAEITYIAGTCEVATVVGLYRTLNQSKDFVEKQLRYRLRQCVHYGAVEELYHGVALVRSVHGSGGSRAVDDLSLVNTLKGFGMIGALLNGSQVTTLKRVISKANRR
jgi:hypothetical protein